MSGRWFQQVELWLLVLLVLGIHFTRLDAVMLHGEETHRGAFAAAAAFPTLGEVLEMGASVTDLTP